jgi:hypothetical protein
VEVRETAELAGAFAAGLAALRRFYRPFVLIQVGAVALVAAYHLDARVRAACAVLAAWKTAGGLPFAAAAGAVAGGLLPEIAKLVATRSGGLLRGRGGVVLFNCAFFAVNGVVIDLLYRGEARLFGADARLATVVEKTAFDQLLFTPLWLAIVLVVFQWRQQGFRLRATLASLQGGQFYRRRLVPLLLPDWCFWIPMVSIIYAFPLPLQFLLFVLALAAWSLIMVVIADGG